MTSSEQEASPSDAKPTERGDAEKPDGETSPKIDIDDPHVLRPPPEVDDFAPTFVAI